MNPYCKPLHLNLQVVATPLILEDLKKQYMFYLDFKDVLHSELQDFLKSKKIYAHHVESFYSPPNFEQPIHVDDTGGDYVKMNFVWGGTGSLMHWYKPTESKIIDTTSSLIDTRILQYKQDEVDLMASECVYSPSLVQTGVPHNITNPHEHRLCLSLILCYRRNRSRITMQEALTLFAEYL